MTTPPGPPQQPPQPGGHDPTQARPQQAYSQVPPDGPDNGRRTYGQSTYGERPVAQPHQYQQPQYQQPQQFPYAQPPAGHPAPGRQRGDSTKFVLIAVAVLAVIALGAIAAVLFTGGDEDSEAGNPTASTAISSTAKDGTTVDSSPIGSCIKVIGTTSVTTRATDCDTTLTPSFIVAAKLASSDACESAGYPYSVTESGGGASSEVLCLVPNFRAGTCYQQPQFSIGIDLTSVSCSSTSSPSRTVFRINGRSESGAISGCSGSDRLRSDTHTIQSTPSRQVTFCSEILGDGYTWR